MATLNGLGYGTWFFILCNVEFGSWRLKEGEGGIYSEYIVAPTHDTHQTHVNEKAAHHTNCCIFLAENRLLHFDNEAYYNNGKTLGIK